MIKVEKTAKTLDEGIKNLMSGAKQDYVRMSTMGGKELTGYSKEQVDNWALCGSLFFLGVASFILALYSQALYSEQD